MASKANNFDHIWSLNGQSIEARREFDRSGDLAKLDEAIEKGRQAVACTPPKHSLRPVTLTNLGTSLLRKYEHSSSPVILNEALRKAEEALGATASNHPHRGVLQVWVFPFDIRYYKKPSII